MNTKTNKTNSTSASTMAELMQTHNYAVAAFTKRQLVKGKIVKLSSKEILLDINGKTEAVVLEKDKKILRALLRNCTLGQIVEASVLNPESETGQTVVSLRRFIETIQIKRLEELKKNQEVFLVSVTDATRGGFLVETPEGITAFLPSSYLGPRVSPDQLVGQKIEVVILDVSKDGEKVIVSQKAVGSNENFAKVSKKIKIGEKVSGQITTIAPFGLFVSIPFPKEGENVYVDGLIHISEISWEKVEELSSLFTLGGTVEAIVIGLDTHTKRVDLSIKRLTDDPFTSTIKQYAIDQKVSGVVTDLSDLGVIFMIGEGENQIEGLIRKEKIPPTTIYEKGQKAQVIISQIDHKKRRLVLLPALLEKPLGYR